MSDETDIGVYHKVDADPIMLRAMRILRGTRSSMEKIFDSLEELIQTVNCLRSMGCVIVLTMGTWDLFHIGHGTYIEKGKSDAEKMYPEAEKVIQVVAVDSDELTRARKGPRRPVVSEDERTALIAKLESVDMVIIEKELGSLHKQLPHDVRVISHTTGEFEPGNDPALHCEHLLNLPPQAETSTSARVRMLILEGGQDAVSAFRKGFETLIKEMEDGLRP